MSSRFGLGMAAALMGLLAGCGGASYDGTPISRAFCDKGEECLGMLPPDKREDCLQETDFLVGNFPAVPASASACVAALSCTEVGSDPWSAAFPCFDLTTDSFMCNGESLDICAADGSCGQVPCQEVCARRGGSYRSCMMDSPRGYDLCICGP